jgi:hypothetical protein
MRRSSCSRENWEKMAQWSTPVACWGLINAVIGNWLLAFWGVKSQLPINGAYQELVATIVQGSFMLPHSRSKIQNPM